MGFIAVMLWSITVGLVRSMSEQVGSLTAGAAVYITGGLLAVAIQFLTGNPLRVIKNASRIYAFSCGILFILYTASLYLSLGMAESRYQALELGLINYLWPSLTILFSLFMLSQKANIWLVPGTILAITGIYFITTNDLSFSGKEFVVNVLSNPIAYTLGFIAAVSWAIYSNLTRLSAKRGGNANLVPLFILVTGLVLFVMRFFHPENTAWNLRVIVEILVLGCCTSMGYIFWDAAMKKGDLILVVSVSYLIPFFSTLFSALYLGVIPKYTLWMGSLLITTGSFLSWRSVATRSEQKQILNK